MLLLKEAERGAMSILRIVINNTTLEGLTIIAPIFIQSKYRSDVRERLHVAEDQCLASALYQGAKLAQ